MSFFNLIRNFPFISFFHQSSKLLWLFFYGSFFFFNLKKFVLVKNINISAFYDLAALDGEQDILRLECSSLALISI